MSIKSHMRHLTRQLMVCRNGRLEKLTRYWRINLLISRRRRLQRRRIHEASWWESSRNTTHVTWDRNNTRGLSDQSRHVWNNNFQMMGNTSVQMLQKGRRGHALKWNRRKPFKDDMDLLVCWSNNKCIMVAFDRTLFNQYTSFSQNCLYQTLFMLLGNGMENSKWNWVEYDGTPVGFSLDGPFSCFPASPWKQMQPLCQPKSLVNDGDPWPRCPLPIFHFSGLLLGCVVSAFVGDGSHNWDEMESIRVVFSPFPTQNPAYPPAKNHYRSI